ncbi:hypothetical protein NQ318_001355 [Aromia moschata]|uniref:DUF4706 domain-containing protein n=1 Tax=Aromia moschata TaxID=1265417 RepID=A0AAV8YWW8_9CUCU|nr:hypothetical protein NQ318_001355 [Aromia moschata]
MSLKTTADEYFSSLNSIASRLYSDLNETKSSYEELWSTLSDKEQQDILSESIIKPEVSIKYGSKEENPKAYYAVKLIFDDHCSYRDEHSGPFSFRTQSQRDLSIFQTDKPNGTSYNKVLKPKSRLVTKLHNKTNPEPEEKPISNDKSSNILPKTGLDFLDNW